MNKENCLDFSLYQATGIVLKKLRINKGLSLDELAKKIGNNINKQALSRYERAVMRLTNKTFLSICKALNEEPKKVWELSNELYYSSNFANSRDELVNLLIDNLASLTKEDKKDIENFIKDKVSKKKK